MPMSLINISSREALKPIYRVFSLERFLEALKHRRLTLVRPRMWEDPWENYLYRYMHKMHGGSDLLLRWYGEDLFAQCWTFHRETDAMWRIYSHNKDGVKVKSHIRPLLEALRGKAGGYALANCFVGKVEYMTKQRIKDVVLKERFIESVSRDDTAYKRALTLLFKRREFSHEKEVRLIHDCWQKEQVRDNELFDIDIDPNQIFELVTFDPRLEYLTFKDLKTEIRALGYNNKVFKSKLYSLEF